MEHKPRHRVEITDQDKLVEAIEFMRWRFGAGPHIDTDCFGVEHTATIDKDQLAQAYTDMCEAFGGEIATQALADFRDPPTTIVN